MAKKKLSKKEIEIQIALGTYATHCITFTIKEPDGTYSWISVELAITSPIHDKYALIRSTHRKLRQQLNKTVEGKKRRILGQADATLRAL